jgi:hypothetical protein
MLMRRTTILSLALLLAASIAACGGGGSGGTVPAGSDDGADDGTPVTTQEAGEADLVVLRYDLDGDGVEDLVTVDTGESPYTVVEALLGTETGGTVDATVAESGRAVDGAIAAALSEHLADAAAVGDGTELLVESDEGETVTVTVFE